MKAVRIPTGRALSPFGDPVGLARVLDRPLAEAQEEALRAAGVERVDRPPAGEPYLVFSDRTWFTPELIRRLIAAGTGRLRVESAPYAEAYEPLQELPGPGLYELGVHPAGQGAPPERFPDLPPLTVDLELREHEIPGLHPALRFASRPFPLSAALVHQVDHWSHLLRVNLLALAARGLQAKLDWDRAPPWKKLAQLFAFLVRVRPLNRWDVVRGLCVVGCGVRVHPTATVELSVLEDGVEVGPGAVVRGSHLGRGAKVEEHCTVNLSVLGANAKLGRYAMLNLSVVYPGANVSFGNGYQATLIGQDAFMGWGITALDLSFGKPVRVEKDGELVDSGQHFLGVCVGHRARLAFGAVLNAGVSVPNDGFLMGEHSQLLKRWGDAPPGVAAVARDGVAVPFSRSGRGG